MTPGRSARLDDDVALRRAFSETCDPAAYVPRAACEAALETIRAWSASDGPGSSVAALVGTPGLGKTMLLRVAEARANARSMMAPGLIRALYLPYVRFELPDLSQWIHGLLGRAMGEKPSEDGATAALESLLALGGVGGEPFFLMLDDADSIPAATVQALFAGLPAKGSPLRILMALNPDSKATRLLATLHSLDPVEISFRSRMSAKETGDYVRERMRFAGIAEAEVARVVESEADRLASLSSGVPRAVHSLATVLLESAGQGGLREKRDRENWMGRPIEDEFDL